MGNDDTDGHARRAYFDLEVVGRNEGPETGRRNIRGEVKCAERSVRGGKVCRRHEGGRLGVDEEYIAVETVSSVNRTGKVVSKQPEGPGSIEQDSPVRTTAACWARSVVVGTINPSHQHLCLFEVGPEGLKTYIAVDPVKLTS